jgi:short-subunit dehydrogenase
MGSASRPVALVTGASGGIGRAFALALGERGHDLVLVARDTARLEAVAKEIEAGSGAASEILTADLSDSGALATVEARLADPARPVDVVVNNAGFGTYGKFTDLPVDREAQEIRLNVVALMRLTHAGLAGMVARGTGGVINVASIGGLQPTPGYATYGATKAFVISFTEALHEELKGTGVRCMVLSPGFTRTEFQDNAGVDPSEVPSFMWQDASTVVDHALRAFDKGRASCVPGALNAMTAAFTSVSPNVITRKVAAAVSRRTDK